MNNNDFISDLAEETFIAKIPKPLRYILFIPSSILGSLIVSIIYTWLNDSFSWHVHFIIVAFAFLGAGVLGYVLIVIGAYVIPKFQLQTAFLYLVVSSILVSIFWTILLAGGTFHALHNIAYYTALDVIFLLGAIGGFAYIYEQKQQTMPVPILVIGVAILVGSVTWFATRTFSSNQTTFSISNVKPYTSNADGFLIDFPINPTIKSGQQSTSSGSVTWNEYTSFNTGGTAEYNVGIYNYPLSYGNYDQFSYSQQIAALQSGVTNGAKGSSFDEKVQSMTAVQFRNYTAVFAHLSIKGKYNIQIDGYELMFEKGQKEFSIFTAGVSKANFNQFANSFQFVN